MPDLHEDDELETDVLSDEDVDVTSPDEIPIAVEEDVPPVVLDEDVTEEIPEVHLDVDEEEEGESHVHKVYPVDPDRLNAPLRPDELWDEDGTI